MGTAFGSKSNIELMFFCIIFDIIDYEVDAALVILMG